jgi:glutamate-1-semialdehyde 2,1-aminomutase
LRDITTRHGRLLIFDEVISGFRVHPGGAQGLYEVKPDLTTLAKILAGGLPGGCLAGRADVLAALEFRPGKPKMKHPGTFNANPLSAAAGAVTLRLVANGEPCRRANETGRRLRQCLNDLFARRDVPWGCPITTVPGRSPTVSCLTAGRWTAWRHPGTTASPTLSGGGCCCTGLTCPA